MSSSQKKKSFCRSLFSTAVHSPVSLFFSFFFMPFCLTRGFALSVFFFKGSPERESIKAQRFKTGEYNRYTVKKTLMTSNRYSNWHACWQACRAWNSKQRTSQRGQAEGDCEHSEVNMCVQTPGASPHLCSPSQVFPPRGDASSESRTSLPRSYLPILQLIISLPEPRKVRCLISSYSFPGAKHFFFFFLFLPFLQLGVGLNEAFYMLECPSWHYMFDMSWFVRD